MWKLLKNIFFGKPDSNVYTVKFMDNNKEEEQMKKNNKKQFVVSLVWSHVGESRVSNSLYSLSADNAKEAIGAVLEKSRSDEKSYNRYLMTYTYMEV